MKRGFETICNVLFTALLRERSAHAETQVSLDSIERTFTILLHLVSLRHSFYSIWCHYKTLILLHLVHIQAHFVLCSFQHTQTHTLPSTPSNILKHTLLHLMHTHTLRLLLHLRHSNSLHFLLHTTHYSTLTHPHTLPSVHLTCTLLHPHTLYLLNRPLCPLYLTRTPPSISHAPRPLSHTSRQRS